MQPIRTGKWTEINSIYDETRNDIKITNIMESEKFLQNFDIVFPAIYNLTIIAIVLLISSATVERTFSLHKLLVSYLRNRISQEFSSNLGLLSKGWSYGLRYR